MLYINVHGLLALYKLLRVRSSSKPMGGQNSFKPMGEDSSSKHVGRKIGSLLLLVTLHE